MKLAINLHIVPRLEMCIRNVWCFTPTPPYVFMV